MTGTKSIGAIFAIGIIALVLFAIGAYTLSESSPRVGIKKAVERSLPVTVDGIDIVRDPVSRRGRLIIRATPKGATLTALDAAMVAARATEVLRSREMLPIDYDVLEVASPAGLVAAFDRDNIDYRINLEIQLPDLAATLGAAWGARPDLRIVEDRGELGVALAARPPAREDPVIARDVFNSNVGLAFVMIPSAAPGVKPAIVRRSLRR